MHGLEHLQELEGVTQTMAEKTMAARLTVAKYIKFGPIILVEQTEKIGQLLILIIVVHNQDSVVSNHGALGVI